MGSAGKVNEREDKFCDDSAARDGHTTESELKFCDDPHSLERVKTMGGG